MNALSITHIDNDIVVVHKPAGLLVHRTKIDKYETQFLLQLLRDQIGQQVFPVHRLDKPTSGLMVLALHKEAARKLTQLFTEKGVYKAYLAIVRGYVDDQVIDYPLKEELDKMTDAKAQQNKEAQEATTHLTCLSKTELPFAVSRYQTGRFSLVKLEPKTGRKHQLRRHMAHIRHPILGDTTHGDGRQNRYAKEHMNLSRLALVASELRFSHPFSGENLSFSCELDDNLSEVFSFFKGAQA